VSLPSDEGHTEHDPDFYFNVFVKAAQQLTKNYPELLSNIKAMSLTCFRDSAVLLDENIKPLYNTILWMDQRVVEPINKIPFINRLLARLVGMTDAIVLNRSRSHSLWHQKYTPEIWQKMRWYAPISSYLTYLITGRLVDCPSNCTGHYPLNYKKGTWYQKTSLRNIYEVPPKKLIELQPSGTIIGTMKDELAVLLGLPAKIPFVLTGSDKSTDTLGVGALESDVAAISYGTASTVTVTNKKYYEPETYLPAYQSCVSGYYNLEVQIYRGYWMLSWFSEQFANEEVLAAKIEEMSAEELLNQKMEQIPAGSDGLLLQPYWESGIKRPLALGSIVGFNGNHTKIHFYKAIIEGIAYALKEGLSSIERHQHQKVKSIRVSGGGSQSDAICQITADIFNLPVTRSTSYESSSLGCAMTVFLALKEYQTPQEAKKMMYHLGKTFTPIKKNAEIYAKLYKNYLKLFPHLDEIYRSIRKIKA
ncbi:MAG: FGGY-family carbohydrate kinase, partial [Erysipelotrichaceae bacterium]|nr:FGGY-family carbohydrate kinase [Erysipelotrichaceae bacterium]